MVKISLTRVTGRSLDSHFGEFRLFYYQGLNPVPSGYHRALTVGDVSEKTNILVRIQSSCSDGETFYDAECDCRQQLDMAMELVQKEHLGVIVYLLQEGKGLGLINKTKAKALAQKEGIDMYDACLKLGLPPDARKYDAAVDIIRDLNVTPPIRLLTNNPDKIRQLVYCGIEAVRVPLQAPVTAHNFESLRYREKRFGHLLELPDTQPPY